jgi:putative redox protein
VRAVARRRSGYTHDVEIEGGHSLVIDEPEGSGGADEGPSPTRTLAAALAACVAITIEMYVERKEWELGDIEVVVDMEYGSKSEPRSFEVTIKLPHGFSEEQVQRIKVVAAKCPIQRSLSEDIRITERVELV